jgi:hypothetical protein
MSPPSQAPGCGTAWISPAVLRRPAPAVGIKCELCALSGMLRYSIFALILLTLPAAAQQGQRDFPRIVPRDWTLVTPAQSDEWRAVSPRRDAWLLLYANPVKGPIGAHLHRWGTNEGDRVTYRQQRPQWSVVSGFTPDSRIFYRETMLACGGRKWHNLEFEYPATDKPRMDEFVTRASHALGAYSSAGC